MKDFKEKNVYITGGSSGIGLAIAEKFAGLGSNLLIISRSLEKLEKAKKLLDTKVISNGQKVAILSLDVSNNDTVRNILVSTTESFGKPDVLINCAGLAIPRKFGDIGFEQFDYIMKTNMYGPWNTCSALMEHLVERRGYVVNVSSIAGFIGVFGYTDYCASKFAIIGFSEALRSEYQSRGVRISVLCPPDTDTPAFEEENKTKPAETKAISENAKLMMPNQVAEALIDGMKKENFLIIPGLDGKLAYTAKRLAPNLVHYLMQKDIKKATK